MKECTIIIVILAVAQFGSLNAVDVAKKKICYKKFNSSSGSVSQSDFEGKRCQEHRIHIQFDGVQSTKLTCRNLNLRVRSKQYCFVIGPVQEYQERSGKTGDVKSHKYNKVRGKGKTQTKIITIRSELERLRSKLRRIQEKTDKSKSNLKQTEVKAEKLRNRIEKMEQKLESLKKGRNETAVSINVHPRRIPNSYRRQLRKLRQKKRKQLDRIKELQEELEEAQGEGKDKKKLRKKLKRKIKKLKSKSKDLKERIAQLKLEKEEESQDDQSENESYYDSPDDYYNGDYDYYDYYDHYDDFNYSDGSDQEGYDYGYYGSDQDEYENGYDGSGQEQVDGYDEEYYGIDQDGYDEGYYGSGQGQIDGYDDIFYYEYDYDNDGRTWGRQQSEPRRGKERVGKKKENKVKNVCSYQKRLIINRGKGNVSIIVRRSGQEKGRLPKGIKYRCWWSPFTRR